MAEEKEIIRWGEQRTGNRSFLKKKQSKDRFHRKIKN
jgi:hypothetical protein